MSHKILIVDDMSLVRDRLAKILIEAHYQVVGQAASVVEALAAFHKVRPDLVLMDIVLPDGSGIEAVSEMLTLEKTLKVIMISGMDHDLYIADALYAGAVDYLVKPCSKEEVLRAVERALISDDIILGRTAMQS